MFNQERAIHWYGANLKKIVFLLFVLVFFTLTIVYIQFLNVFITPSAGFGIFILVWYILFSPHTEFLIFTALVSILLAYLATVFNIGILLNEISHFLFLIMLFIFINLIKVRIRK